MAEPVAEQGVAKRPSRGRSIGAAVCIVIAALLTVPAAVAFWGQRTLNDGQRYLETVGPLVDSPEVQAAIATKVTTAIQQQVDVEAILNEVFAGVITDRPRLQALVGPIAGAVNGLIETQVREFIASDTFAEFWVAANTRAQATLVRLLQGDETGAISLQGDQVVLDVSEVIDQVKQRLVARGLTIVERIPIPDIDRQIVLMDAPQLEQARTIYAFANPVARWLIVVVALLYLAALRALAPQAEDDGDHRGGAGGERSAGGVRALGRPPAVRQRAGRHGVRSSEHGLLRQAAVVPPARSAGAALAGFDLGGRGLVRRAQQDRNRRPYGRRGRPRDGGFRLADGPVAGAGRWVAANARWLRVVVGVLGVVVLLWGNDVSLSRLFWSVVLVGVLLAVVQVLVGAGGARRTSTAPAPIIGPEPAPGG